MEQSQNANHSFNQTPRFISLREKINELFIKDYCAKKPEFVLYEKETIPTGCRRIKDEDFSFQSGALYALASRPEIGKTSLMIQLSVKIAKSGIPVYYVSQKMNETSILLRLFESYYCSKYESLNMANHAHLGIIRDVLDNLPITICDSAKDIDDVSKLIDKNVRGGIVFIDDFHITEKESRILKTSAEKNKTAIVFSSQLPNKTDFNEDNKPTLEDTVYENNPFEATDGILILHRKPGEAGLTRGGIAEIIIAKNIYGKTLDITTRFDTSALNYII